MAGVDPNGDGFLQVNHKAGNAIVNAIVNAGVSVDGGGHFTVKNKAGKNLIHAGANKFQSGVL
ncbi:MAG: hypothetical protein V3S64_13030 [bacterium]